MKLYKYMPGKRANDFFDAPLLRIANPNGLNDPFEFSITRDISIDLEKIRMEQATREDGFREYIENFKSYGVISLSETYDNLLMWSHYADEHRGAVFEFIVEDGKPGSLFLCAESNPITESNYFGKVDYRKFRKYQDIISSQTIPDIRRHYIFTKSDEWMYEKEQRFALHYSCADIVRVNKIECENAFHSQNLDYKEFESGDGVKMEGKDLWIDIKHSKISDEILKMMWLLTKHMNSFFFKLIDFERVAKVIIGCRNDTKSFDETIKNITNPKATGKFYYEGNFVDVLKAHPSKERFELEFEKYRGNFFTMLT